LIWRKAPHALIAYACASPMREENSVSGWRPIGEAPYDAPLELAVIEHGETIVLAFACRRTGHGWANASTGAPVLVSPTHWRPWSE
jgi:hypothetical protein